MNKELREVYRDYVSGVQALLANVPIHTDGLDGLKSEISDVELLVPIIGPFSAGKSSLLNSFLGNAVLGVGLTPETELATELRFSEQPYLLALQPDGSNIRLEVEALKSVNSRASEFTHLQLYLDNPRLELGAPLVLVDMPGFGSSLAKHNQAIAYYLPRGAHFIVLISAEDGTITRSMMRQLDDLQTYGRGFTVVLSKTNLRSAEDVESIAMLVEEQIRVNFGDHQRVIRIGADGGENFRLALDELDPNRILASLFEDRLKAFAHALLDQINVAAAALQREEAENRQILRDLDAGLKKLEQERDRLVEEVEERRLDPIVNRCLAEVARELEDAQDELVHAAQAGHQEAFSRSVSEVVRTAVSRVVKREVEGASRAIIDDFTQSLSSLDISMKGTDSDETWLQTLTTRVTQSMQTANSTLTQWSESLAEHNARELKREKSEGKDEKTRSRTFQGLATALAVTTSVVVPVVELAIIFLPEILSLIRSQQQKTRIREMVVHEVIPSVQRQLHGKLAELLKEQLDGLVVHVSQTFEHTISEQKRVIDDYTNNHQADGDAAGEQLLRLCEIKRKLEQLTHAALYSGANR